MAVKVTRTAPNATRYSFRALKVISLADLIHNSPGRVLISQASPPRKIASLLLLVMEFNAR